MCPEARARSPRFPHPSHPSLLHSHSPPTPPSPWPQPMSDLTDLTTDADWEVVVATLNQITAEEEFILRQVEPQAENLGQKSQRRGKKAKPEAIESPPCTWKAASQEARHKCEQILEDLLRRTNHPAKLAIVQDQRTLIKKPLTLESWLNWRSKAETGSVCTAIRLSETCIDTIFLLWLDSRYGVGVFSLGDKISQLAVEHEEEALTMDERKDNVQYRMFYNGRECGGLSADFEAQARNLLSLPPDGAPMECVVCFEPFTWTPSVFRCGHTVACAACTPKLTACAVCRATERNETPNYAMSLRPACADEDRRSTALVYAALRFMRRYIWEPLMVEQIPKISRDSFFRREDVAMQQIHMFKYLRPRWANLPQFEFLRSPQMLMLPFVVMAIPDSSDLKVALSLYDGITEPKNKLAELTAQIYNAILVSTGREPIVGSREQTEVSAKETSRWWGF